jgi:hypothetical protein
LTCGCNEPTNDHGDSANLTKAKFAAAGKTKAAGGKTIGGVLQTAVRTHRKRK